MTTSPLSIAVLVCNGFDETGFIDIQKTAREVGASLKLVSVDNGLVSSWTGKGYGLNFPVDAPINRVLAADYDLLVIPGGERSVAKLMTTAHTKRIFNGFMEAEKPVVLMGEAVKVMEFSGRDAMPMAENMSAEGNIMMTPPIAPEMMEEFVSMLRSFMMDAVSSVEPMKQAA